MTRAIVVLGLFGAFGLVLGVAQFAWLAGDVRRYVRGGARTSAVALHVARMLALAGFWVVIARFGRASGLLAAFVGFLVARSVLVARGKKAP